MNLTAMVPRNDLASTGYCPARPTAFGAEYLVCLPAGGTVIVDLSASPGKLSGEWFNPSMGVTTVGGTATGGADRSFTASFSGDAVLYIWDSLDLRGRPGDQTIYLDWTFNGTLPVTSIWQIDYASETGTVLLPPISILTSTVRSCTLTDLTNYVWYTVTLNAMVSATSIMSSTVRTMPTDIFV
jgi:hypothetical protein